MVKLKGPAGSTTASGKLANALIFGAAKKTAYVKKHARPANPQTDLQTTVRAAMAFFAEQWRLLSTAQQDTWNQLAGRSHTSGYHAFVSYNQKRWTNWRHPTMAYPAAEAGGYIHPGAAVAYGGVGMITIRIQNRVPKPTWGWCLFRTPTPVGAAARKQLVAMVRIQAGAFTWFADRHLEAGTYYYRQESFDDDGTTGNIWGPYSATAT
jgi:hypothetical protein